jgi:hypothetical protein
MIEPVAGRSGFESISSAFCMVTFRVFRGCTMNHPRSLTLVLLLFAGCGDSLQIAPVSGTVTLDGGPLAGASITTQPVGSGSENPGPGSFGLTDAQGRYELELVKPARKGAIIGEHRVMISKVGAEHAGNEPQQAADGVMVWTDDPRGNRQPAGATWPARFTDGSLQLQVPVEGTDQANFDLKTRP